MVERIFLLEEEVWLIGNRFLSSRREIVGNFHYNLHTIQESASFLPTNCCMYVLPSYLILSSYSNFIIRLII